MQKESESKKVFSMENVTVFDKPADIQATAKLVIKDFVEVMTTSKPGEKYNSDTFMLGDIPMAISVNPNGSNKEKKGTNFFKVNYFARCSVICHIVI